MAPQRLLNARVLRHQRQDSRSMMAPQRLGASSVAEVRNISQSALSSPQRHGEGNSPRKMTLQEKLDFIDDEIRKIHLFCTKSGYNATQIEHFAQPFFHKESQHFTASIWVSGKAWKRRVVSLATMLVATVLLFRFDPAYQLAGALSKQGAIQILPVWDWTQLYHTRCWVSNPLYKQTNGLQLADCEVCEGVANIERAKNLRSLSLVGQYLSRDQPLIVEDGMKDWGQLGNMSINSLAEVYRENQMLRRYHSCGFASSIRGRNLDHIDVLNMVNRQELDKFYAQWENCNSMAAKTFRKMYKRPYFLPPTVSLAQTNSIFISANYTGRIYKPIVVDEPMVILMQIKGQSELKLEAREPCSHHCPTFHTRISAGQMLVATELMWRIDYLPTNNRENIAVAIGGDYD